jgi:hypothetical protein
MTESSITLTIDPKDIVSSFPEESRRDFTVHLFETADSSFSFRPRIVSVLPALPISPLIRGILRGCEIALVSISACWLYLATGKISGDVSGVLTAFRFFVVVATFAAALRFAETRRKFPVLAFVCYAVAMELQTSVVAKAVLVFCGLVASILAN